MLFGSEYKIMSFALDIFERLNRNKKMKEETTKEITETY